MSDKIFNANYIRQPLIAPTPTSNQDNVSSNLNRSNSTDSIVNPDDNDTEFKRVYARYIFVLVFILIPVVNWFQGAAIATVNGIESTGEPYVHSEVFKQIQPQSRQETAYLLSKKGGPNSNSTLGSCTDFIQENLRWNCSRKLATQIGCHSRVQQAAVWGIEAAEPPDYWKKNEYFRQEIEKRRSLSFRQSESQSDSVTDSKFQSPTNPITFYDSVSGFPLFRAPINRSWMDWIEECQKYGWPSFRDNEVIIGYVRMLPTGEIVSVNGTHLGDNLPDEKGNRYCIDLLSIAGYPS